MNSDVTIIIPCYGQAEYLLDAVNSCLKQITLPEEIIILLMDKDSQAMYYDLIKLSPIISCIVSDKLIPAKARNLLISKTNTKYIIPLDADDMLPSHYILRTLQINADIVYTDYKNFPQTGKINVPNIIEKSIFLEKHPPIVVTTLMKKSVWEIVGGYNEDFIYGHENWEFMYRAFILGLKFKKCNDTFLRYRQNEISAGKKAIENFRLILNQMKELYPQDFNTNNEAKERISYVK